MPFRINLFYINLFDRADFIHFFMPPNAKYPIYVPIVSMFHIFMKH